MAHIPDGFLSPAVLAGTSALSVAALSMAARRTRSGLAEREAPLLGAATAFVFAAQMLNFPLGPGTSAHLLGGVLVAAIVGPWAGMLVVFSVVLVQALLFQDGGIAALGANTLNLAVLGAGGGYVLYRWIHSLIGDGPRRRAASAGTAAFLATLVTGCAVAVQIALSGVVPLSTALLVVGGAHVPVALAEAALTGGVLALALRSRPDLVAAPAPSRSLRRWSLAVTGLAAGLAVAAVYGASSRPDPLEAAAERLRLPESPAVLPAPFPDYAAAGVLPWIVALAGVGAAFLLTWGSFRLAARRRRG